MKLLKLELHVFFNQLQVNANGAVIRSEILGAVKMKCYLSGMPELRLGLNDKVMFENTGRSKYQSVHVHVMVNHLLTISKSGTR